MFKEPSSPALRGIWDSDCLRKLRIVDMDPTVKVSEKRRYRYVLMMVLETDSVSGIWEIVVRTAF